MTRTTSQKLRRRAGWPAPVIGAAVLSLLVTAFGPSASAAGTSLSTAASKNLRSLAGTTITLEGPNQWTSSGSSFGAPYNKLIAKFKKVTGITIKTTVLPVASFHQTESTQLAAGTAPDVVFDQATYQPYMVHHLQGYLKKPNPFIPGNKKWISQFRKQFYNLQISVDDQGNVDFVPFNLFLSGLYYNEKAFKKAGVASPPATWKQLINACGRLKKAGYTPFAMDDGTIGTSWTAQVIFNMLASGQGWYKKLNVYTAAGKPGKNTTLTTEDVARAVALGSFKASMPIMVDTLKLLKQIYNSCMTKNWTGIAGSSGALAGLQQFASGKAAIAWGTDFGYGTLASVHFKVGSMPFPTITSASTPGSKNFPAEWGASVGGTSYMIPANVKGKDFQAALRFLQFMSAPKEVSAWLRATGGLPAIKGVTNSSTSGFLKGHWADPQLVGPPPAAPPTVAVVTEYDTYLLGDRSLSKEVSHLQTLWEQGAAYEVQDNNWQSQSWASKLKS